MRKFLKIVLIVFAVSLLFAADAAMSAKKPKKAKKAVKVKQAQSQAANNNIDLSALSDKERLGLSLAAELPRANVNDESQAVIEREAVLRDIINRCAGTEEAENAYWLLADLYLDAFSEPNEDKACEILEKYLKSYGGSRWAVQVKCRLLALYAGNADKADRAAELKRELEQSGEIPNILRANLRAAK